MYYGQQIVNVNGENGARAYQLPPNSSALLLDSTNPIVWLVTTDGAGYKSVTPYEITPYKAPEPVDFNALVERLNRIEEKLNESDTNATEHTKRSRTNKTADADE